MSCDICGGYGCWQCADENHYDENDDYLDDEWYEDDDYYPSAWAYSDYSLLPWWTRLRLFPRWFLNDLEHNPVRRLARTTNPVDDIPF